MKFRALFTALLCAALAAPAVVAQVGGFPDVPEDHPRADAVRWAAQEELFLGFPDGNLRPDEELTRTQFVKVAERLYDSADAWTRADWAQVMYAGRPSLTGGAAAATSTTGDGGPSVTGAPAGDVSLRCGWPLGEAEPVDPDSDSFSRIFPELRFPITPCEPPVTYRIEFQGQTFNLPYASGGRYWTPKFKWTEHYIAVGSVRVTEFRPGGPVSGRVLGEAKFGAVDLVHRTPTYPEETIPPTTAPPSTAAATTTTAAPPRTTATVPPPPLVEDVPFAERDVVIHWFIYYRPEDENGYRSPGMMIYVADPNGPIPAQPRSSPIDLRVAVYTDSGDGDWARERRLDLYGRGKESRSAFPVWGSGIPRDFQNVTVEEPDSHPFRSITIHRVEPPSDECLQGFRDIFNTGRSDRRLLWSRTDCHPPEWAKWWGVRATVPAS